MDDEKTYQHWIASRTDINPEPDMTNRVMQEIRKYNATTLIKQPMAVRTIAYQILENRFTRYALAIALSALGLFRVAYVPSLIFMP